MSFKRISNNLSASVILLWLVVVLFPLQISHSVTRFE